VDVIRTLYRESPEAWRRTLLVAGVAGLANASILAVINRGAATASGEPGLAGLRLLLLFGLSMLAFYLGKRYSLIQASVIVEHMVRNRLVRVMDKIRKSELEVVEGLGRGEIYTKMAQDTSLVSHSGLILVNAAQQAFVLTFCLLYIAWLSRPAFIATVITIATGVLIYSRHASSLGPMLAAMTTRQADQVDTISHIIDGFKEVRLNSRKSDAVFEQFRTVTKEVRDLKIAAQISFCVDIMFSDLFFYTLLSVVVFLLPRLVPTYAARQHPGTRGAAGRTAGEGRTTPEREELPRLQRDPARPGGLHLLGNGQPAHRVHGGTGEPANRARRDRLHRRRQWLG
jgi:putative ATP-binding cassette transporter